MKCHERILSSLALGAFLLGAAAGVGAQQSSPTSTMVTAELAFAETSVRLGISPAFLAFLAEDSVMFVDRPVNGRELYGSRQVPGLLDWRPDRAEASAVGDLGFTTGPWRYLADPAKPEAASHGQFFTIWKRVAGEWRVAVDLGIDHEPVAGDWPIWRETPAPPRWVAGGGAKAPAGPALEELDRGLGRARAKGRLEILAADARLLRQGLRPIEGAGAVRARVANELATVTWEPLGSGVARSADLGYTWGRYQRTAEVGAAAEEGFYLRAWRRAPAGAWQLVIERLAPKEAR